MLFWALSNQGHLLAPFYWVLTCCSQECPGCHFHLGRCQGKDQLLIFRRLQLWLPYPVLAPFLYFLYPQGEGCRVCVPCSSLPSDTTLGSYPSWCHLLGAMEDNKRGSYLLSACCELSIYISNFKFSHDPRRMLSDPFL